MWWIEASCGVDVLQLSSQSLDGNHVIGLARAKISNFTEFLPLFKSQPV
jgi:hypothetical protein